MNDDYFDETILIDNVLKYYYALKTFSLSKLAIYLGKVDLNEDPIFIKMKNFQ